MEGMLAILRVKSRKSAKFYLRLLLGNMEKLGFRLYISKDYQGCIISTFVSPDDEKWDFKGTRWEKIISRFL
jgi:hypothetical protein